MPRQFAQAQIALATIKIPAIARHAAQKLLDKIGAHVAVTGVAQLLAGQLQIQG